MELAFILLLIVALVIGAIFIFKNRKHQKRAWKIYNETKEVYHYAELFEGKWRFMQIACEHYSKNAPRHAIYIQKDWSTYPDWAQDRKETIMKRLRQELKAPTFTIIETD